MTEYFLETALRSYRIHTLDQPDLAVIDRATYPEVAETAAHLFAASGRMRDVLRRAGEFIRVNQVNRALAKEIYDVLNQAAGV